MSHAYSHTTPTTIVFVPPKNISQNEFFLLEVTSYWILVNNIKEQASNIPPFLSMASSFTKTPCMYLDNFH